MDVEKPSFSRRDELREARIDGATAQLASSGGEPRGQIRTRTMSGAIAWALKCIPRTSELNAGSSVLLTAAEASPGQTTTKASAKNDCSRSARIESRPWKWAGPQ